MIGNSHPQHAARFGEFFKNGHLYALSGQMIGRGQPRRPGPDNGRLFVSSGQARDGNVPGVEPVRRQSLEIPNGNGIIHLCPSTGLFASMGTDPAQHAGQGQVFHDDPEGLFIFPLAHHLHIALHIQSGGQAVRQGALSAF